MSQVVTINTKSFICQASDLRVSYVNRRGIIAYRKDLLPKTIVVKCVDGIYLLGVTGSAKIENKWTPFWIGEELAKMSPSTTVAQSLIHLNNEIDRLLRPDNLGFWFAAAGLVGTERFLTLMGNIDSLGTPENPLLNEPSFLCRNDLHNLPAMSVIGPIVDKAKQGKIWQRYANRGLLSEKETYGAVARLGIQVIRQSSQDRRNGPLISPCCNSVCLELKSEKTLVLPAPTKAYLEDPFPFFVRVDVGYQYSAIAKTFREFVDVHNSIVPLAPDYRTQEWGDMPKVPPAFVNPDSGPMPE